MSIPNESDFHHGLLGCVRCLGCQGVGAECCDQLSDAARSAPRNIAEGFARYRHKEFAQFVRIAKGSEAEVLNHFIDLRDLRLISEDDFLQAEHLCRRAMKAANGLIRFLESTPDPAPAPYKKRPAP